MAIAVTISGVVYFTATNVTLQSAVSARPFVAFAAVTIRDGIATIPIAGMSRSAPLTSYRLNVLAAGAVGHATALPAAGLVATISIRDVDYRVAWTDVGGTGTLVAGDLITVSTAEGALPARTAFTFYLLWSDGSMLQSTSWTT